MKKNLLLNDVVSEMFMELEPNEFSHEQSEMTHSSWFVEHMFIGMIRTFWE